MNLLRAAFNTGEISAALNRFFSGSLGLGSGGRGSCGLGPLLFCGDVFGGLGSIVSSIGVGAEVGSTATGETGAATTTGAAIGSSAIEAAREDMAGDSLAPANNKKPIEAPIINKAPSTINIPTGMLDVGARSRVKGCGSTFATDKPCN